MSKTLEAPPEATDRMMAEVRPREVCSMCKDDSKCDDCAFEPPAKKETTPTRSK
jgi:hypothetical protein